MRSYITTKVEEGIKSERVEAVPEATREATQGAIQAKTVPEVLDVPRVLKILEVKTMNIEEVPELTETKITGT